MTEKSPVKDVMWSEKMYHLSDVVHQLRFPCVVRVCHGYYSSLELETFSHGDLLHIKDCVTLQKAAAHFIQRERTKQNELCKQIFKTTGEEILIPLNFKGPMKLVNDSDIKTNFNNVQELIDAFPRFVRIDNEIEGLGGKQCTQKIKLSEGRNLQLLRLLPGTLHKKKKNIDQLICMYKEKEIALSASTKGKFTLIPDATAYTLAILVETLPLPRCVQFIDDQLQVEEDGQECTEDVCGSTVRLNRIAFRKVIIGYLEPVGTEMRHDVPGCVIALPLDNQTVKELEVNILQGYEAEMYENNIPRNIKDIFDKEYFGNWLYVERASDPKIRYLFDDFPEKKVTKNAEYCIDDISSTTLMRNVEGCFSGRENETDEEHLYEEVIPIHTPDITYPATSNEMSTTAYGNDNDTICKKEAPHTEIKKPERSSKSTLRRGYINMPFFKRSAIKQTNLDCEYQAVKTPPSKSPRKDLVLQRQLNRRHSSNSIDTETATATADQPDSFSKACFDELIWSENPIYSYGDGKEDIIRDKDTLTGMSDDAKYGTRTNRVMDRPISADSEDLKPKYNTTNSIERKSSIATSDASPCSEHLSIHEQIQSLDEEKDLPSNSVSFNLTETDSVVTNSKSDKILFIQSLIQTLEECFKKLPEVCEMEKPVNNLNMSEFKGEIDKEHGSKPATSEKDIRNLIEYFNTVSHTSNDKCNTADKSA